MTLLRQNLVALAALLLCVLFAPIRTAAMIPHSAPLASSQSALDQSSPAAVLTLSDAAVSGMCRNDPVNNFDPLGLLIKGQFPVDDCMKRYLGHWDGDNITGYTTGTVQARGEDAWRAIILVRMMQSPHEFVIAGSSKEESLKNVAKHVDARVQILKNVKDSWDWRRGSESNRCIEVLQTS